MKAILVIDMPDMCWECPLCHNDCVCDIIGDVTDEDCVDMRCPLKPMPKRKIVGEIEKVDDFMKSDIQIINEKVTAEIMLDTELLLASGYNLCIDEILGEQNDTDI